MIVLAFLVLGLTCFLGIPDHASAVANVGCLFDPDLCLEEEHCFNDHVFGLCHLRGTSPPPDSSSSLQASSRDLLEREIRRLLSGGYRWPHRYTQCVIRNLLHNERHRLRYDPGICARLLQLTLPEVAKEIVQDLTAIGPEELALIRFRPSLREDHSDFADELFSPHSEDEQESEEEELEDQAALLGQLLTKRGKEAPREEEPPEEETQELQELKTWMAPLRDAWEQISHDSSRDDRFPDQKLAVVQTDLSSDLTSRPAYSEGGVQWLPVGAEEATQEILAQTPAPMETKQVAPPPNSNQQKQQQANLPAVPTDGATSKQAADAFWRDVNEANNRKEGVSYMRSNDRVSSSNGDVDNLVQALPELDDLWRPMVEEEEEDEYKRADNGGDQSELSSFSRPMRYDIKKPGPAYYVHEPEDDTPQAQENQMIALLRTVQQHQDVKKWESFPKFPKDGSTEVDSLPEQADADVTDEEDKLQQLVLESMRSQELRQPKIAERVQEEKRVRSPPVHIPVPARQETEEPKSQAEALPHPLKEHLEMVDTSHAYLLLKEADPSPSSGEHLVRRLEHLLSLPKGTFSNIRTDNGQIVFKVNPNPQRLNASTVAIEAEILAEDLKRSTDLTVLAAGIGDKSQLEVVRQVGSDRRLFILTFVLCGCVVGILLAVSVVYLVRRHARSRQKLQSLAQPDSEPSQDYQDLCRQRMQRKSTEKPEPVHGSAGGGGQAQQPKRVSSLSQSENSQASPSSRSSTSSWSEEPVTSNMDISTGHMILSYMEDHLKNKDRLEREWEALCAYEAEPCAAMAAALPLNANKNRYPDVLPYDHSRVVLNDLTNVSTSDYINASTITDHDPRNPAYIATQGPLPHTAADFWQMIWEQGSVVVVTLSRLMENGVALCHRYWPEEGSEVYHIYEVHLVSEHIWCDDYLVRSFYLKNLKTSETRTVTQFHFLSWPENGVPASTKALLEFRRKVNKSYRGRSCPIVVHCSDGSGRTGTYCLIDMVLNRMAKGAKEIDIAATLEHIRDQRTGMVKTQAQFEFVLMAIAEEVHAILKALSN